jgi:hypothetical protein
VCVGCEEVARIVGGEAAVYIVGKRLAGGLGWLLAVWWCVLCLACSSSCFSVAVAFFLLLNFAASQNRRDFVGFRVSQLQPITDNAARFNDATAQDEHW